MSPEEGLVIRTGCLTCRAYAVPCDPTNPNCKRYTSTIWSSNRRRKQIAPTRNSELSAGIRNLEQTWVGTLKERQSLHFFTVITSPELSGLLDVKFWQKTLLQAAQSDNAIKHAVAAIGASHEHQLRKQASRLNAETDGLQPFALKQCNKAISALIGPLKSTGQQDLKRTLTASLLLACFESFAGNRQGAIPHVLYSRKLLEQYKRHQRQHEASDLEKFPINVDLIEPLVAHYELQLGDYVCEENPDGMIKTFNLKSPLELNSLSDARISLEGAIASLSVVYYNMEKAHSDDDVVALERHKSEYSLWLQAWDRKFTNLLCRLTLDRNTLAGCRLLKAHQAAVSIFAAVPYGKGEGVWSSFIPQYRTVVDLMAEILNNLPKKGTTSQVPQTPYFSATMGMTEPLYCTVARCTDETIVNEAKDLLTKLPLSEGIHSSWKIAYIEKTLCAATGKHHI